PGIICGLVERHVDAGPHDDGSVRGGRAFLARVALDLVDHGDDLRARGDLGGQQESSDHAAVTVEPARRYRPVMLRGLAAISCGVPTATTSPPPPPPSGPRSIT